MTVEILKVEQGSPEWIAARLGIPTASEFGKVMAKGEGKTRRRLMYDLAGERITGEPREKFSNEHMERGKLMEDAARNVWALRTGQEPTQIGFVRNTINSRLVGASPDSLVDTDGLLEIKTKLAALQIEALLDGVLPSEHKAQVQGQLLVAERQWCDFVSYWPRIPPLIVRVHRDDTYIATLVSELTRFNNELDQLVETIKLKEAA